MEFVVVTGPPCSGKSTWIAEHAGGADVFSREGLDNDPAQVARERAEFAGRHAGRPGACYIEACRMPELGIGPGDSVTRVRMDADGRICLARLEASGRGDRARWREVIADYFRDEVPARGPTHIDASPHGDEWAARPGKRGGMARRPLLGIEMLRRTSQTSNAKPIANILATRSSVRFP